MQLNHVDLAVADLDAATAFFAMACVFSWATGASCWRSRDVPSCAIRNRSISASCNPRATRSATPTDGY